MGVLNALLPKDVPQFLRIWKAHIHKEPQTLTWKTYDGYLSR